jgi:2-iminobutanoate/2-iminopropanoate deaminase
MKKIIFSSQAPPPIGPYSQAVESNSFLFVSGQIALDSEGKLQTQDIASETQMVMKNIGHILHKRGLGYEHIVKCTIFIKNMSDFSVINAEYGKFFLAEPPARETVEVSRLPKDVNIEISCIAISQK